MWQIAPKVMVMPQAGWELAMLSGPRPEIATIRFLLPMSLAAAGAEFFNYLYPGPLTLTETLVMAVITFCAFFLGYYLALVLAKLLLPGDAKDFPSSAYGKLLTMTGIASLAAFHVLECALPMLDTILEFLPIWTVFIIYRGMKMVGVSADKQPYAIGAVCVVTVCAPPLVVWFLSLFA